MSEDGGGGRGVGCLNLLYLHQPNGSGQEQVSDSAVKCYEVQLSDYKCSAALQRCRLGKGSKIKPLSGQTGWGVGGVNGLVVIPP